MAPLRAAGCCLMAVMALVLTSCTSPCRMMADVGVGAWHEPAELFIDNADTLAPCDLLLVVRSNTAFDGDTLTLRIGVLTPDSLRCEESLLLSVPRGGSAAVARETQTVYRRNVVLADSGRYVFTVVPQRTVRGIEAVGLFPVRKRP
ncbi:hypothetical protein [uncultured Alistipes sp.]|uniref:hypothetical protein n=1 Tax=uncultured Alistipes sp. TaxID=538949 RepID=UPI002611DCC6|nr:hypothetical protein [uncultured Alistipes sp.]